MDFFINTEYIDRERELDLMSLGIVDADGRGFYAISSEFDPDKAGEFVRTVVLPQLEPHDHPAWMTRADMRNALLAYVGDERPTFWSWSAAPWDWMAMAQLLEPAEHDPLQANDIVRSTVLPQLEPADDPAWMSRAEIRDRLEDFIGDVAPRWYRRTRPCNDQ